MFKLFTILTERFQKYKIFLKVFVRRKKKCLCLNTLQQYLWQDTFSPYLNQSEFGVMTFCFQQVWAIPASGEATEVLSWRQGIVRTLRILPTPGSESNVPDAYSHKRPLIAMCDSAGGPSPQFCSLSFISLRGGDQVSSNSFLSQFVEIYLKLIKIYNKQEKKRKTPTGK